MQRERVGYSEAKDPNPLRYCGEYFDSDVDEYYLRARTYQPGNGRFTSEDPARDGGNWYGYCGGEPVMHGDPSGLSVWDTYARDSRGFIDARSRGDINGAVNIANRILAQYPWRKNDEMALYYQDFLANNPFGTSLPPALGYSPSTGASGTGVPLIPGNSNSYYNAPNSYYYEWNQSKIEGFENLGEEFAYLLYGYRKEDVTVWAGEEAEYEILLLTLKALLDTGVVIPLGKNLIDLGANESPASEYKISAAFGGILVSIFGMVVSWADVILAVQYYYQYGGFTVTSSDFNMDEGLVQFLASYLGTSVKPPQSLDPGSARHQARIANRG